MRKESADILLDYWSRYSIFTTFEFWCIVALFIVPLIVIILKIDKSKIFLISFYGYSVHMLSFYINLLGVNRGLWSYPFQLIPTMPSFAFDSSFVPVTFMFVYQWTLNHKKNYYKMALIVAVLLAFIIDPIFVKMGLIRLYGHTNYAYRLVIYVIPLILAKLITNVFLWLQKKKGDSPPAL
ncbi:fatty-acid desaturase [Bacillus sp. SLBN-46]|uniref:CBO0543 family protein n=1 Tax=Bacillus sp. SLBN-46 TaxID=3042283 RepID=UPI00285444EC|nr:CBO0543 family protein [Bacillus sp. SLBN-46]MDR6121316.1 fatty-acid desaturase [Bacillus sp. SLBN-46]